MLVIEVVLNTAYGSLSPWLTGTGANRHNQ